MKEMSFDFTNYTFSGLLSVLAALYGVGYPLIIQSIERIYSQYDSSLLANRFVKEPIYKTFQWLLAINLLFAVCTPFLLHANWWNWGFLTIQALLLFVLMSCTFMLFQLMIKYGNAGKLLKYIEGYQINRNNVMDILDLAIYADSKKNYQLFSDCMSDVFLYFTAQQGDNYKTDASDKVLPPVVYDDIAVSIILKLKNFLRDDGCHNQLSRNADIIPAIYNQISKSRIDISAHRLVWCLLNEAVTHNNHSWFKQYWQFADSYASLKYRFVYTEDLRKDKRYFMLRHVMVGALLLNNDRERWLNDVFFYTHSEPEYYGLIPSSFAKIIDMLENIDHICSIPQFQTHNFYFSNEMGGVKDEKYVFREALRYLSLLVIRLWSLESRNLHYHEGVFDVPLAPTLLSDDERAATLMGMMKKEIENYYSSNIFESIPRLYNVEKEKPLQLLDAYKCKCEEANREHTEHPTVDAKKFEELQRRALNFAEKFTHELQSIPLNNTGWNSKTYSKTIKYEEPIETIYYSPFKDIGNLTETVWPNFFFEIGRYYEQALSLLPKLKYYQVPKDQIKIFLQELGYDQDKYCILATDNRFGLDGCIEMQASVRPTFLYIMPQSDVPFVSFEAIEMGKLHPIKDDCPISSNYTHFIECNTPNYNLVVATKMNVTTNADAKGVVVVEINEDFRVGGLHVGVDQTLDDLFEL